MVFNSRGQISLDLLFAILVLVSFFSALQIFSEEFLSSNHNITYDYQLENSARSIVSFLVDSTAGNYESSFSSDFSASFVVPKIFVEDYSVKVSPNVEFNDDFSVVTVSIPDSPFSVSKQISPSVSAKLSSFFVFYSNGVLRVRFS